MPGHTEGGENEPRWEGRMGGWNMRLLPVLDRVSWYLVSYHYPRVVTCESRVAALTQNHPFGTLETPIANGNNVAHNLVTA
jgi:hypothetical protein